MPEPHIAVLTCLWRRPELARLVLRRYTRIATDLQGTARLSFLAVGSEGRASERLAKSEGWSYVEAANKPLGRKWNVGMRAVRDRLSPDAVVIVGSDDWINTAVFEHYVRSLAAGKRFIGFSDIYFLYWKKMKTLYFGGYTHPSRIGEALGLGRCLHRDVLDKIKWKPWWESKNNGLDLTMTKTLRSVFSVKELARISDVRKMVDVGGVLLDIKTPVGICKVHSYLGSKASKWDDTKRVLSAFPEDERDVLLALLRRL